MYQRFPTIVDTSPESIGLPRADRRVLAEIIRKLPVPETEKKRLAMDAGVIDMDIEKMLQHESQEAGKH